MNVEQTRYFSLVDKKLEVRPEQRHWLNAHQEKITRLLALTPADRFVDLGCGEGFFATPLSMQAGHAIGFDRAAAPLSVLKEQSTYHPETLGLAIASGDRLPLPDCSVDKLLCNHVLEHVLDDHALVREMRRVVRSRGLVLIGVPLALSPQVRMLIRCRRLLAPRARKLRLEEVVPGRVVADLVGVAGHVRFYSLTAVRDLLQRHGFLVLREEGVGLSFGHRAEAFLRSNGLLFRMSTLVGRFFPAIGDGVLVLAERRPG